MLEPGDYIKTTEDSWALITFFEGSTIELEGSTEIKTSDLATEVETGSTTILLEQEMGKTMSRVKKLVDPASRYEIETSTAAPTVRGTIMLVDVATDGTTTVGNGEGSIWVVSQGVEVTIPENTQTTVVFGEPPSPPESGLPFVPPPRSGLPPPPVYEPPPPDNGSPPPSGELPPDDGSPPPNGELPSDDGSPPPPDSESPPSPDHGSPPPPPP
jgi:hypothetical protein